MGRSPRPTPPLSPDVLPNGPPPPSPLVPVYLSSPPLSLTATEVQGVALVTRDGGTAAAAAAAGSSSASAREQSSSDAGLREQQQQQQPSGLPEIAGAEDGSSEAGGDVSKARSLSAAVSDSGLSGGSEEGSGSGRGREGGGGAGARQRHDFFVPSGVCLLSTRPETGAMRRALAAYWAEHNGEILAGGAAAKQDDGAGEGGALDAQESPVGGSGGKDEAASEVASNNSQEADGEEEEEDQSVGAWTKLTPDKLRDTLVPFVTEERRREAQDQDQTDVAAAASSPDEASSRPPSAVRSNRLEAAGRCRAATGWGGGPGSGLDFDPSVVLRCLSPRNLCLVVSALLCERKVVLVSSRLSLLTLAGETFR